MMAGLPQDKAIALIPHVRQLALRPGMTDALIGEALGEALGLKLSESQVERIRRLGGIPSSKQLTRAYNDTSSRTGVSQGECPTCQLLVDFRNGKPGPHNRMVKHGGRTVVVPCSGGSP